MSDKTYPEMREVVTLRAVVVGVHKHDSESHRHVQVQLADGQGVMTNLKNIQRSVASVPEDKSIRGPRTESKPGDNVVRSGPKPKIETK